MAGLLGGAPAQDDTGTMGRAAMGGAPTGGGADMDQDPHAGPDAAPDGDADDGQQPNVSPEEQAQYDRFMDRAFRLIYDERTFPTILERMRATPDPVEGLAAVTAMVVSRLKDSAEQAGVIIDPDVLFHGGTEILEDLASTAEKARIHAFTPDEVEAALYRALDIYRQTETQAGKLDRGAAQRDWQSIVQADRQRQQQRAGAAGAGGMEQEGEAPPQRRGLMPMQGRG